LRLRDDGRGIAVDRVARRAIELGAVSAADIEHMSLAARLELIFLAGLSTAEQVTDSSGRGVGMTAVKREVEALGGDLSLSSEPGAGTTVHIQFPLTVERAGSSAA
jgi:two-component system chemotaxis sensor kinase CheA